MLPNRYQNDTQFGNNSAHASRQGNSKKLAFSGHFHNPAAILEGEVFNMTMKKFPVELQQFFSPMVEGYSKFSYNFSPKIFKKYNFFIFYYSKAAIFNFLVESSRIIACILLEHI